MQSEDPIEREYEEEEADYREEKESEPEFEAAGGNDNYWSGQ